MFKPTTFGKFFLYEKLAIGGMAEIFKAKLYGIAGFEKTLVVKQILPEYAADGEFVKMFIDEANIAVSLTHGNIVPVYELGKIGDRYYIAMEYVDGENMETVVDQCRRMKREIPVHVAVEIAIEICKGLDYAHKKLGPDGQPLMIVHRDVSPQNIMVSFDGEVKLVDFGIAKAASKLSLTRVGTLKGKFGYMSPEQASGAEVDGRTDIYAVAIVLWEMLTSTRLFDAENDLDLLKRVRAGAVMPPRMVAPRVPEALERIVLKALTKDLDVRYQQAGQFQLDLQRWLYSRQPEPSEESLSGFMRVLFRREGSPGLTPPPVPSLDKMSLVPPAPEPRRQRDVSYAQSDEIARALEEAASEARRVIVEARPGDELSYDAERSTSDQAAIPEQPDLDNNTAQGIGALLPEEAVEATSTASSSGEGVMVEATSAYSEPTNTRSDTADSPEASGDTIEWDETTDRNARNMGKLKQNEFVERATVEGPIVRVPRRPGGAPWEGERKSKDDPPWMAIGAIPAPPDDGRTTPGEPPRTPRGSMARKAQENGAIHEEEPLFAPRKRGGGRAFFAIVLLLAIGAAGVFGAHRAGFLSLPLPIPTPSPDATTIATDGTTPAATATSPANSTATTTQAAKVTPTAVQSTPTATPAASKRKVALRSSPAGASVYEGSKLLGRTPWEGEIDPARELSVRYSLKGHRDLKKSYGAAGDALDVTETLEPNPVSTPRATAAPAGFGSLSVQAIPWGEVKIDGVKVGNTPLVKHKVKAGPHTIVVTNPDHKKSETKKITVHANVDEDPIVISFE